MTEKDLALKNQTYSLLAMSPLLSLQSISSLNYDAKRAGVDAEVVKMMVDNFSWEIDFSRDL